MTSRARMTRMMRRAGNPVIAAATSDEFISGSFVESWMNNDPLEHQEVETCPTFFLEHVNQSTGS
jgi:hypothetical protein